MTSENCPFCKRMLAGEYDATYFHYPVIMRFAPLNPVVPGHTLFIPMDHTEHGDGNPELVGLAFQAASIFAYEQGYEHYNLITSSGKWSTQTVPHVHIHFVPRHAGDGLQLPWGLPHE